MTDILNSTVYETDDVVAIIEAVRAHIVAEGQQAETLRTPLIRYLNQKKRNYNWRSRGNEGDSYASVHHAWRDPNTVVALLRPSKVELNALIALAEAADATDDDYCAPKTVLDDLITEIWEKTVNYYGLRDEHRKMALEKVVKQVSSKVRLRINTKAKGRKAYTLVNLEKKLSGRKNNLRRQQQNLRCANREVASLKKLIPTIEADIVKQEANLKKRQDELEK